MQCGPSTFTSSKNTVINGTPLLAARKGKNLSFIGQGDEIEYSFFVLNRGNVAARDSFVVDKIPDNTQLVNVVTDGTSTNGITYNCDGCRVFFANTSPSLPTSVNPLTPFSVPMITSNFSLGTQTSPGIWTSPFPNPAYVAVEVDNAQGFLPVNDLRVLGMTVRDTGNQLGDRIRNHGGVLSADVLQSVTNQVETVILDQPGLVVDIESDKDILEACETFYWEVDYYSDAAGSNTQTTMTVEFPQNFHPLQIEHEWNSFALSGGAIPPTRHTLSTGAMFVTGTVNLDNSYTLSLDINGLRGANLSTLE